MKSVSQNLVKSAHTTVFVKIPFCYIIPFCDGLLKDVDAGSVILPDLTYEVAVRLG